MSIEFSFDIAFTAKLALREKQIQQNYRPIIAVHKWFARRPGTLFRSLILSEFEEQPVEQTYYSSHNFEGLTICDPFMGGGTPLLEANRLGCSVIGADINPMATWIVQEEISELDLSAYLKTADHLLAYLKNEIGLLYQTRCPITGQEDVEVKYFLWVKTGICTACNQSFDLFPGYVLAKDVRHPAYVLVCPSCGNLNEVADPANPGSCTCGAALTMKGPVQRSQCVCPHCGHVNKAPFHGNGSPSHRLFAIEYYSPDLKGRSGRLFKKPDADDIARVDKAQYLWSNLFPSYVPEDDIPQGDETNRLHRWGYQQFKELFNPRQLLALETAAGFIAQIKDHRLRRAFATNFSDLLRYQNMLCRYDTMALKSLDIFSIHGFPVGYIQVESNFLGIRKGNGLPVGSGGWINIIEKYAKAKQYCTAPFEVAFEGRKKHTVKIDGEWIGEQSPKGAKPYSRTVDLRCHSETTLELPDHSLDAVFTDPPYYGMVQYGELMHFCYVWLRKLMGADFPGLDQETTRHRDELTGNDTAARGINHFAEGLAQVYARMAAALKPGAPLVFTYHHNQQDAYLAVAMAILDAGLTCSASLPCPAEMGGSIHIHGTGSSIVDTVFVCRHRGTTLRTGLFKNGAQLAQIISHELTELRTAGMNPTAGDIRCIAFGNITRMAIWNLRSGWVASQPTSQKLERIRSAMDAIATVNEVAIALERLNPAQPVINFGLFAVPDARERLDAVAF
ncbi:DNA methylase [Romeria aff. gracilis LEGE 07310]|uniref:DNA methylase n=1 Tax=Vasconcelosia minhoensis LEGE 07310 TaxID=915328 RepID=A0A8J7DPU2_9CYAN|nr:DNA methylase [Romeria gracilis]MBE9080300.1 DNA methylase [Romeria aff. gracilis LEGE 07310]